MYIFKYRLYYIYYYLFCIHSIFIYIQNSFPVMTDVKYQGVIDILLQFPLGLQDLQFVWLSKLGQATRHPLKGQPFLKDGEVLEIVDDTDFPTVLWAITWFLYCSLFLGSLIILMIAVLVLFFCGDKWDKCGGAKSSYR